MPRVALAQDPPMFELSGGYALLLDRQIDETLTGWLASAVGNVGPVFGISGEMGVQGKRLEVLGTSLRFNRRSFLVGPRFSARPARALRVHGQVLAGGILHIVSILDVSKSTVHVAWQPGGSVDVWIGAALGIRVGADYRRTAIDGGSSKEFRLHVGAVVGAGR